MSDELTGRVATRRFLEWLRPIGSPFPGITLTAIAVDGSGTNSLTVFSADAGSGWVAERNERQNCYYGVNPAAGAPAKKASKPEIAAVMFLHVDIDPRDGEDWQAERRRILASLEQYPHRPSAVIDSGNGYQALWRLAAPVPMASPDDWARLEAYNRQIARDLRGDSTHDISRILRLPGLVNIPNEKKRSLGRTEQTTSIVWLEDGTYSLDEFTAAPPEANKPSGGGASVHLPDNISFVGADDLPADFSEKLRNVIIHGDDPAKPGGYNSKSEGMWFATCEMVRLGKDDEFIAGVLLNPSLGVSNHPLRQKRSVEYVARQIEQAREHAFDLTPGGRRVLSFASPYRTAQRLQIEVFSSTIHINGDWLEYRSGAYVLVEDRTMKAKLYGILSEAVVAERNKETGDVVFHPFNPDPAKVGRVVETLQAVTHQEADAKAPPCWLDDEGPPPLEIISCRNGLLHLPTGELLPPTPRFFTRNALEINYDPGASAPVAWRAFLRDLWPDGPEPDVLQEVFGYLLLPDTRLHSIFMLKGPPRSGKGTILRMLENLIGKANVCAPSIAELGKDFGLEPLIGKQLAAITDMRFGKKADLGEIATNLLRISGEDTVSANRKGKTYWTGRLSVRFLILGNELPRFNENSPALAKRFVPLVISETFDGKEDRHLMDKLLPELPGILNWAVEGWRRLQARGRFELPPASVEAVREIQELSSPADAFLAECCDEHPDHSVPKDDLYDRWRAWCERYSHRPGTKGDLTRLLATARPGSIRTGKLGTDERVPSYLGLRLKPAADYPELPAQYDGHGYWEQ